MRHVVHRIFFIGSYEKEEKWLNEMSAKGLQLVDTNGFRYVFEDGVNGEYIYRLELLEHLPSNAESIAYLRFLEETGVEHVASYYRWVYLRKKASEGPFEIYSDINSKMKHYKRICMIANVVSLILLIMTGIYFCEAHNRYRVYMEWISKGFTAHPSHISFIVLGAIMLIMLSFVQIIMIPIRKSQYRLKKQKKISE